MDLDLVINIIEENGYLGLFFWLGFGIYLLPIPNELILMTVGLAASMGELHPFLTFLVSYAGIVAALTTSYLVGRLVGRRLLPFLEKRKRVSNRIDASLRMMEKYHAFSLSLSCFIPGARYLLPLLYGFSRLSYKTFALFAYSGAFVWVLIVFMVGYLFGDKLEGIEQYREETWLFGVVLASVAAGWFIFKRKRAAKIEAETMIEPFIHERRH